MPQAVPETLLHCVILFQNHKDKYLLSFILTKALNMHPQFLKNRKMYFKGSKERKNYLSEFLKERSLKTLNFKCPMSQDLRPRK